MNNFEFIEGGRELIERVEPLWEKLNKHHQSRSSYFSEVYKNFKFDTRKSKFMKDNKLKVKVDLINDMDKKLYVGYCISTIDEELNGVVDSIFVEKEYRKYGLGDKLMKRALEWLDSNRAKTKIIAVAEGNEEVLKFYKRYGFYKRRVILEQKENC